MYLGDDERTGKLLTMLSLAMPYRKRETVKSYEDLVNLNIKHELIIEGKDKLISQMSTSMQQKDAELFQLSASVEQKDAELLQMSESMQIVNAENLRLKKEIEMLKHHDK